MWSRLLNGRWIKHLMGCWVVADSFSIVNHVEIEFALKLNEHETEFYKEASDDLMNQPTIYRTYFIYA